MNKTINFELSKRLTDLWLLWEINNNYLYYQNNETWNYEIVDRYEIIWDRAYICNTLTIEEAIEFFNKNKIDIIFTYKNQVCYGSDLLNINWFVNYSNSNKIKAIEEIIEELLDNNLLWIENKK